MPESGVPESGVPESGVPESGVPASVGLQSLAMLAQLQFVTEPPAPLFVVTVQYLLSWHSSVELHGPPSFDQSGMSSLLEAMRMPGVQVALPHAAQAMNRSFRPGCC